MFLIGNKFVKGRFERIVVEAYNFLSYVYANGFLQLWTIILFSNTRVRLGHIHAKITIVLRRVRKKANMWSWNFKLYIYQLLLVIWFCWRMIFVWKYNNCAFLLTPKYNRYISQLFIIVKKIEIKLAVKLHLEEEKLWNRIVYTDAYRNKTRIAERY